MAGKKDAEPSSDESSIMSTPPRRFENVSQARIRQMPSHATMRGLTSDDVWAHDVWDHNSRNFILDPSGTQQYLNGPNRGLGEDTQWSRVRKTMREPFCEFLGTFTLVLFGDGAVAQVVLSAGKSGDFQSISWGWG